MEESHFGMEIEAETKAQNSQSAPGRREGDKERGRGTGKDTETQQGERRIQGQWATHCPKRVGDEVIHFAQWQRRKDAEKRGERGKERYGR